MTQNIRFYPIVYTRTQRNDFGFYACPESKFEGSILKDIEIYVRQTINEDHYPEITQPRHLFVACKDYILWGTGMRNKMFLPREFHVGGNGDNRPIRGFWGGVIDVSQSPSTAWNIPSLPFDFEEEKPFAKFLFEKYVKDQWLTNRVVYQETDEHPCFYSEVSFQAPEKRKDCVCFVSQQKGDSMERFFRSTVSSPSPVSILTGLDSESHAMTIARKTRIGLDFAGMLGQTAKPFFRRFAEPAEVSQAEIDEEIKNRENDSRCAYCRILSWLKTLLSLGIGRKASEPPASCPRKRTVTEPKEEIPRRAEPYQGGNPFQKRPQLKTEEKNLPKKSPDFPSQSGNPDSFN